MKADLCPICFCPGASHYQHCDYKPVHWSEDGFLQADGRDPKRVRKELRERFKGVIG